jgi:hypothetical protein
MVDSKASSRFGKMEASNTFKQEVNTAMEHASVVQTIHFVDGTPLSVTRFKEEGLVFMSLIVGTNVPQGGDSGHGGKTILSLSDIEQADIKIRASNESGCHELLDITSLDIVAGGDEEAYAMLRLLRNAADALERQLSANYERRYGSR